MTKKNIWLDGMMGLVVGDALGCPVQFLSRNEIKRRGLVTGMEGYGTYNKPEGTWTDDSSMALACLDSMIQHKGIKPDDIMERFVKWDFYGAYTPFGESFDQGNTCSSAIWHFYKHGDYKACGKTGEHANGNGALMRILPVCLYYAERRNHVCTSDDEAIQGVHVASALTHNHLRSQMACGLYYFMTKALVENNGLPLKDCLQAGLDDGFCYYRRDLRNLTEMSHYGRLYDLKEFATCPEQEIKSSGYVVDSLEAAIWCLITTDTLAECLLKSVNLGDDTDTVAAIAGGLAGLYYGYEGIPKEWLDAIQKREYVEEMCKKAADIF